MVKTNLIGRLKAAAISAVMITTAFVTPSIAAINYCKQNSYCRWIGNRGF